MNILLSIKKNFLMGGVVIIILALSTAALAFWDGDRKLFYNANGTGEFNMFPISGGTVDIGAYEYAPADDMFLIKLLMKRRIR